MRGLSEVASWSSSGEERSGALAGLSGQVLGLSEQVGRVIDCHQPGTVGLDSLLRIHIGVVARTWPEPRAAIAADYPDEVFPAAEIARRVGALCSERVQRN
jgi:hypothetical protein